MVKVKNHQNDGPPPSPIQQLDYYISKSFLSSLPVSCELFSKTKCQQRELKMMFKFLLLLSIVSVTVLIEHTEGCPQPDFIRKHTCDGCNLQQALAKAEDTNSRRKRPQTVRTETVFIVSNSNDAWESSDVNPAQEVCKTKETVPCYNFRKNGLGQFNEYKLGNGRGFHDATHGHYEYKFDGACIVKGKWIKV